MHHILEKSEKMISTVPFLTKVDYLPYLPAAITNFGLRRKGGRLALEVSLSALLHPIFKLRAALVQQELLTAGAPKLLSGLESMGAQLPTDWKCRTMRSVLRLSEPCRLSLNAVTNCSCHQCQRPLDYLRS